jgi:tRNA pseudouridine55 synthase
LTVPEVAPDGLLVIDKPAGRTSHDVVQRVRKLLGTRRVGHGGTLDPDATGVLLVALGRATRFFPFLSKDSRPTPTMPRVVRSPRPAP